MTTPEITVPELAAWLQAQTWSDFAQSLAAFHAQNGYLTPKQEASARSMHAKVAAKAAPAVAEPVVVPTGHYALVIEGVVKFFKVNSPTEGRWAGRTFVDVQASDEYFKAGREYSATVLSLIAADPLAAMKLYGLSLGRCGHCRKTLTNSESRAAGIGPVCARKMGW